MKLYWSPRSPFVRKVMAVAIDAGLDGRIECVRTVADSLKPNQALMRVNPWGKIPTLETDGGVVLYDSDVICDYLDGLAGEGLAGRRHGMERWRTLAWRAFANEMLDGLIHWRHERLRELAARSARLLAAFELKAGTALDRLEEQAAGLSALDFRAAQIPLACALGYLDFRYRDYDWRAGRSGLSQWLAAAHQAPALARTVPVDDLTANLATGVETLA